MRFKNPLFLLALTLAVLTAAAAMADIRFENRSLPTTCAEEDNIDLRVSGPGRIAFQIEATHPAYLHPETVDNWAPVWAGCDWGGDDGAVHKAEPARLVLYEDERVLVTGVRYGSFWRPDRVPFRVADVERDDLHLIQFSLKGHRPSPVEVLVVYPPDGYWRGKPLPPEGRDDTAFGTSFLVGPVEDLRRPVVRLEHITFDPATLRLDLAFALGGAGSVSVVDVDGARLLLDVALDLPEPAIEIAALRSMFVRTDMADGAEVRWRGASGVGGGPVLDVRGRAVDEIVLMRSEPSIHNTSAPDVRVGSFAPL